MEVEAIDGAARSDATDTALVEVRRQDRRADDPAALIARWIGCPGSGIDPAHLVVRAV